MVPPWVELALIPLAHSPVGPYCGFEDNGLALIPVAFIPGALIPILQKMDWPLFLWPRFLWP
jgi:hypothetical protein